MYAMTMPTRSEQEAVHASKWFTIHMGQNASRSRRAFAHPMDLASNRRDCYFDSIAITLDFIERSGVQRCRRRSVRAATVSPS